MLINIRTNPCKRHKILVDYGEKRFRVVRVFRKIAREKSCGFFFFFNIKGMDGLDVVCKGICKDVRDCVREYLIWI